MACSPAGSSRSRPASQPRNCPRADNARWNTAGTPTQAYGDGSVVVNLGTLIDNPYEIEIINGVNVLQVSSFDSANPDVRITRDVQAGVVGLLAFYGRDTSDPTDGIVDVYDTTTPANNADWLRVMSVRLIVVSRSGQYEKGASSTPANPSMGSRRDTGHRRLGRVRRQPMRDDRRRRRRGGRCRGQALPLQGLRNHRADAQHDVELLR